MNEQEAKDAFEKGRLQPHCPGCNGQMLMQGKSVKMVEKGTYNYMLSRAFQCIQCGERFVATIGKPANED